VRYSGRGGHCSGRGRGPGLRCRGPALRAVTTGRMTAEGSLLRQKTCVEAPELIAFERQRKGCSREVSQRPALQVSSAVTLRRRASHYASARSPRGRNRRTAASRRGHSMGLRPNASLIARDPARSGTSMSALPRWPGRSMRDRARAEVRPHHLRPSMYFAGEISGRCCYVIFRQSRQFV
jgi:hypothetical protein